MIKAMFFDVDNTLYCWKQRSYIPSALSSIARLQKKGVKMFLCTSRPFDSMKRFHCFDLGIHWDGWVGANGAVAFSKGKYVRKELMDPLVAKRFIATAKSKGLMMEVVTPLSRYVTGERNRYYDLFEEDYEEPWCPRRDYRGGQVTGFLLYSPEEHDAFFAREFPQLVCERFHPYAVDVMPIRHSKGKGIASILDFYGWKKEEAMGFGDDLQDIAMLEGLDHFVAMGNGREEVKKVAEFVTDRVEDDGIAKAFEHFGFLEANSHEI